jgi:ubiquinone/menaquinone biosynthesis C-methylase UbiE
MSELNDYRKKKFSKEEYDKHIKGEEKHFNPSMYKEDLTEKSPPSLEYFLKMLMNRIKEKTGFNVEEHLISEVNKRNIFPEVTRILSIGSGPAGREIRSAKKFIGNYLMDCIDINEQSIKLGQEKAELEKVKINFIQQDINELSLESNLYDVIFASGSLHHMVNLEHIALEVKKGMKSEGVFIVNEPVPKNGNRLFDESVKIANELWKLIPTKYKLDCIDKNHQERFIHQLPDMDQSADGFECVRSEDLSQVLKNLFKIKIEVPGFAFARRFFNKRFGCNYNLENETDKAIIDLILRLDEQYSKSLNLKPEHIFLVLEK